MMFCHQCLRPLTKEEFQKDTRRIRINISNGTESAAQICKDHEPDLDKLRVGVIRDWQEGFERSQTPMDKQLQFWKTFVKVTEVIE